LNFRERLFGEGLQVPRSTSCEQNDLLSGTSAGDSPFDSGHFPRAAFIFLWNPDELDRGRGVGCPRSATAEQKAAEDYQEIRSPN